MNKYTEKGYDEGWIRGCPKCGGAGVLTVDKTFQIPGKDGYIAESIFGRKCTMCSYECSEYDWQRNGQEWNGEWGE